MAYDCDSAKAALLADYTTVQDNNWDAYWYLYDGMVDWNAGNDHAAVGHILDAGFVLFGGINTLTRKDTNYDPPYYNCYLWEYGAGTVTAKAICEAWAKDDFKYRALTIAFIDRMRQLLWDEPFYVKWAAKPESETE